MSHVQSSFFIVKVNASGWCYSLINWVGWASGSKNGKLCLLLQLPEILRFSLPFEDWMRLWGFFLSCKLYFSKGRCGLRPIIACWAILTSQSQSCKEGGAAKITVWTETTNPVKIPRYAFKKQQPKTKNDKVTRFIIGLLGQSGQAGNGFWCMQRPVGLLMRGCKLHYKGVKNVWKHSADNCPEDVWMIMHHV